MRSRSFQGDRRAGQVRSASLWIMASVLSCGLAACGGPIPGEYLKQAEPGVTLTSLSKKRAEYQGKVVILGGVIVAHKSGDNRVWLHIKNRPLDEDYVPHIPITREGPEAGHYWVMVWNKDLPKDYQHWARVTVVGRVLAGQAAHEKDAVDEGLVLSALYLHGWDKRMGGYGIHEEDDSGTVRSPSAPKSLQKNASP